MKLHPLVFLSALVCSLPACSRPSEESAPAAAPEPSVSIHGNGNAGSLGGMPGNGLGGLPGNNGPGLNSPGNGSPGAALPPVPGNGSPGVGIPGAAAPTTAKPATSSGVTGGYAAGRSTTPAK